MSRRVILDAMIDPYPAHLMREGDECWAVSGAFRHQLGVTRVFVMDDLDYFPDGFADELNLLPKNIRVVMTKHDERVMRSEAYPIHDVLRYFHDVRYFNSTLAYMIALAVYEGFDEIVVCGAHWPEDSEEYMSALNCLNFWLGVAMGKGCKIGIHGPCVLAKSHPWEPDLYGYVTNETRHVIVAAMAATYRWAASFPLKFITHVDIDAEGDKPDAAAIDGDKIAEVAA